MSVCRGTTPVHLCPPPQLSRGGPGAEVWGGGDGGVWEGNCMSVCWGEGIASTPARLCPPPRYNPA